MESPTTSNICKTMLESIKPNWWELCGLLLDQHRSACPVGFQMKQKPMETVSPGKDQWTSRQSTSETMRMHSVFSVVILVILLAVLVSFCQSCMGKMWSFRENPFFSWGFFLSLGRNSPVGWKVNFFFFTDTPSPSQDVNPGCDGTASAYSSFTYIISSILHLDFIVWFIVCLKSKWRWWLYLRSLRGILVHISVFLNLLSL